MATNKQQAGSTAATSTNPKVTVIFERTLAGIRNLDTAKSRTPMTLPISYDQFCRLVAAQAERIMWEQGRPARYEIDRYIDPVIRRIYEFSQSGDQKGIALIGGYGTGKTLLMRSYIRAHNALVLNADGEFRRGIYEETVASQLFHEAKNPDKFSRLQSIPLLIDELGREAVMGRDYGNEVMPVVDLLFERWNRGSITHITSNFTLESLSDKNHYGAMLGSRLRDMFDFITLPGTDRRG